MPVLVSIVIPTYNRAHVIGRALRSCRQQSLRDFEIVIADDEKSTDGITEALAAFPELSIRLLSGVRGKAAAARNAGVRAAAGTYIAFLDSDDEFLPHKLEACVAVLERGEADAVYSQTYVDCGVGRLWVKPPRGIRPGEDIAEYLFVDQGWVHPSTLVLPRTWALKAPFVESIGYGDDAQFAIDLVHAGAKLRMIEEPLAVYYDSGGADQLSLTIYFEDLEASNNKAFVDWMESKRQSIPSRAYDAFKVRVLARMIARRNPRQALGHLWNAYRGGAFDIRRSLYYAVQIFCPHLFRTVRNLVVRWKGRARAGRSRQLLERQQG